MRFTWMLALGVASGAPSALPGAGFDIPAWAFDRGNVKTFTSQWADAGPMIAFGGRSPIFAEYDLELPAAGRFTLAIRYAAGTARPVELSVDGRPNGQVCRDATGSWNTSGARWEESTQLDLTAGKHRFRLQRDDAFPHVVALRLESPAIPDGYQPRRPGARKLPAAEPVAAKQ